jgi:hypothetical protein
MTARERLVSRPITNSVVGLVLLFLTNLFLAEGIPINLLTLIICAIGGLGGVGLHLDSSRGGYSLLRAAYPRVLIH